MIYSRPSLPVREVNSIVLLSNKFKSAKCDIKSTRSYRAVAQAVSRRLPTAAARVRVQVRSCEIFGGQSDTGTCFLRVLQFKFP
jgi:hypothetical protein